MLDEQVKLFEKLSEALNLIHQLKVLSSEIRFHKHTNLFKVEIEQATQEAIFSKDPMLLNLKIDELFYFINSYRKKFKEINETLTVINGKLNYINDLDLKVVEE